MVTYQRISFAPARHLKNWIQNLWEERQTPLLGELPDSEYFSLVDKILLLLSELSQVGYQQGFWVISCSSSCTSLLPKNSTKDMSLP